MTARRRSLREQLLTRPQLLDPGRRRELLEAAASSAQLSPRGGLARLRTSASPIAQTGAAAAVAWTLASDLLGHDKPYFAPVAAIVSLGATRGQRARQAIEMIAGVTLGVGVGDVLIHLLGTGALQLALVITLAMVAAVALNAGRTLLNEAAVSATFVAAIAPTSQGFPAGRVLDALIGGTVALVFSQFLFPVHPMRVVRDAAESVLRELAQTLGDVAAALSSRDLEAAERSLLRARRVSDEWSRFERALDVGREATELAPRRRRFRRRFQRYRAAHLPLDLIVRDVHVLARGVVRALMIGDRLPPRLALALDELATAIDGVAAGLRDRRDNGADEVALQAARLATELAPSDSDISVSVLVGYTQATAADVLRALGHEREPAHELVGHAVTAGRG